MDSGSTDFFVTPEEKESGVFTQVGIQTDAMREMWKKLTPENIVMDSTACISRYKHVLLSFVSVDRGNKGHVVAWLIVQGESEGAMTDLMEELKKRCGETKPLLFASDAAAQLFNAWLVMRAE